MTDAPVDDHQAALIDEAVAYARDGDYFRISGEMIDAIIQDRQALIDVATGSIF